MKSHSLFKLTFKLNEKEIAFIRTYIKDQAKNKSKDAYIELFNQSLINSFANDEEILKSLKSTYLQNHYSAARHYLYNLVLKALRLYYATNTVDHSNLPFLNNADKLSTIFVLIDKELFEEAYKLINKYIKDWEREEDYSALATAHKFLDRIELLSGKKLKNFKNMALAAKYAQKQATKYRYDYLDKEITLKQNRLGVARKDEEVALFRTYLNSDDFKTNLPNEKYYWNAKSKCHLALLEFKEAYYCYEQLLVIAKKRSMDNSNTQNIIINIWLGLMDCALSMKNFDNFHICKNEYLKLLKTSKSISKITKKIFALNFNYCNVRYFDLIGDVNAILSLSDFYDNIEQPLNENVYGNLLVESYFIISKAHAVSGNFQLALDWLQKAINKKDNFSGPVYVINFCFIYIWLMRYQLKDFEMLRSITDTAYRYMRKNKATYQLEKNFLSFFRAVQNNPILSNVKKQIKKLNINNKALKQTQYNGYLQKQLNIEKILQQVVG